MKNEKLHETLFSSYKQLRENSYFPETQQQAKLEIFLQLEQLMAQGYNTYIIGLEDVFDIFVAAELFEYREHNPELQCFVVVYKGQHIGFSPDLKQQVNAIAKRADCILVTSEKYHRNAFSFPNEYFINTLKMSVCYYNQHGDGGVLYACNRDANEKCVTFELIDTFDYLNKESPLNK